MHMRTCSLLAIAGGLVVSGSASGVVLFDYGISQLGSIGGCWQSYAQYQNFTEDYTNNSGASVRVNEMSYWSCYSGLNGMQFQIKVTEDTNNDGVPDADVLAPFMTNAIAETHEGTFGGYDVYRYDFAFSDIIQPNGAKYSWGVSGDNFEAAQLSIYGPGNGFMWQYSGNSFGGVFETSVGDMMIRLGSTVPAPGAASILGLAGLIAGRRHR